MLKTVDFNNVELFAVGTWNGKKFTQKDLDNIVNSYQAEKGVFSIPIKLGHNDAQKLLAADGMPAAGWIENVKRVGDKLVGDFKKVPQTVGDLIKSGAFRKRSVELNPNFKIGDNVYPLVLTGLALLGDKLPAVDTLADIAALYSQQEITAEEEAEKIIFEAAEEETFDDMLASLDDFVATRVTKHFKGRPGAPMLRGLHQAFRAGLQRAVKANHSKEGITMDKATLQLLGLDEGADDAAIEAAIKTKFTVAPVTPATDESTRAEMAKLSADFLKLQNEMAAGKAEVAVTAAINMGKILPAQKDFALKFALRDPEEFGKFVESQPQLVEIGERGSSNDDKGANQFSRFEPTAAEKAAATTLGVTQDEAWRQGLMMEKAKLAGVEIPAEFFSKKSA